jgi:hypothetical protein
LPNEASPSDFYLAEKSNGWARFPAVSLSVLPRGQAPAATVFNVDAMRLNLRSSIHHRRDRPMI